jgi:hypothetical protein
LLLHAGEFSGIDFWDAGGDKVAECVGGVIATQPLVVRIGFKDIGRVVGVVLEVGECSDKAFAAFMEEEGWRDAGSRIPEAIEDFGPTLDTIGVGGAEGRAEVAELSGDGTAVVLPGEEIAADGNVRETPGARGVEAHTHFHGLADDLRVRTTNEEAVAQQHVFNGLQVAFGNPTAFGVFVHDPQVAIDIEAAEEEDGIMGITIIHGGKPFDGVGVVEVGDDMDAMIEGFEELARLDVPITVAPGGFTPAGQFGEDLLIIGVSKLVILNQSLDEAGFGFSLSLPGNDEGPVVPVVADATGIGGGIDARPPAGFGGAAAGFDIFDFAFGKRGSFFDSDDIVFQSEVGIINLVLVLIMLDEDAGAVVEDEHAGGGAVSVLEIGEEAQAEIFEGFTVGLAGFAEEEDFEAWITLAIIGRDLSEEPVRFASTARAAEANHGGAAGEIAEASGGTGGVLAGLKDETGTGIVGELVRWATEPQGFGDNFVEGLLMRHSGEGFRRRVFPWN